VSAPSRITIDEERDALRAEVSRLTKERDEARLEWGKRYAEEVARAIRAEQERDEARAMAQRPEEHGAAMQVRAERLEAALRAVRGACMVLPFKKVWEIIDAALAEGTK